MIYNLVNYLKTQLSSLAFVCNGFFADSPDVCVSVNEGPGNEKPWLDRQDLTVQFMCRAKDRVTARVNAHAVYNKIKKRFSLSLAAVTVGGTVYPQVTAWSIIPIQAPTYLDDDENGRPLFVFNVEITTTQKGSIT